MKKLLMILLGILIIVTGIILICLEVSADASLWMGLVPLVGFGLIILGASIIIESYPEKFK